MNNYNKELWTKKLRRFAIRSKFEYNCGGYAFNTHKWYCLTSFHKILQQNSSEVNSNILAYHCKKEILNSFDRIREIKDISELKENEYGVAFKACNEDFHFCKFENGVWSHKPGRGNIEALFPNQVYSKKWNKESGFRNDVNYDSKTIYFAVEKN